MFLPKRWRNKPASSARRRKDAVLQGEDRSSLSSPSEERMEFLAEKALGISASGSSSGSGAKRRMADLAALEVEMGLGSAAEFNGEELEMACRCVFFFTKIYYFLYQNILFSFFTKIY